MFIGHVYPRTTHLRRELSVGDLRGNNPSDFITPCMHKSLEFDANVRNFSYYGAREEPLILEVTFYVSLEDRIRGHIDTRELAQLHRNPLSPSDLWSRCCGYPRDGSCLMRFARSFT
jgi:hypothetical protein